MRKWIREELAARAYPEREQGDNVRRINDFTGDGYSKRNGNDEKGETDQEPASKDLVRSISSNHSVPFEVTESLLQMEHDPLRVAANKRLSSGVDSERLREIKREEKRGVLGNPGEEKERAETSLGCPEPLSLDSPDQTERTEDSDGTRS